MSYNNNDYQPASGKVVKTDGSVVNEGDGYNSDGSQNVVIKGSLTELGRATSSIANGATTVVTNIPCDNYTGILILVQAPYSYDVIVTPTWGTTATIASTLASAQSATTSSYRGHQFILYGQTKCSQLSVGIKNDDASNTGSFTVVLMGIK